MRLYYTLNKIFIFSLFKFYGILKYLLHLMITITITKRLEKLKLDAKKYDKTFTYFFIFTKFIDFSTIK